MNDRAFDKSTGRLFLITGNSGSGKDALIQETIKIWPEEKLPLRSAVRYITRPSDKTEPHFSISRDIFYRMENEGKFFITWQSYDVEYGIGKEVLDWISGGISVLVNISRTMVPDLRQRVDRVKVVFVYVPLEVTMARLEKRNREAVGGDSYLKRLLRAKNNQINANADCVIDNTGPLKQSAEKLRDYILGIMIQ